MIRGIGIELVIDGNDVYLSKKFSPGELAVPGPIQVTDSSLEIRAGTQGLEILGEADIEVQRLGTGRLKGTAASGRGERAGGFSLSGEFDFDSTLFDPAKVSLRYEDGVFSGGGELGIKQGKVKGIQSATITASVEGERWSASGSVQPSIPGIDQGDLALKYAPETGMEISGALNLSNQIPGIRGGKLEAHVKPKAESEGWCLQAAGTAQLDIPGVDAGIHVSYDDGAFLGQGNVGYERGMLSGGLQVGVTNMAVGESGRPEAGATGQLAAFGGGNLSVQIAPWLKGTVGVKLGPNGEVEVSGEVAIPDVVEVFPEKAWEKNLLRVGVDIPIVGVAVAGQRIGIFARIEGGLDLSAGIGPGQLKELAVGVTYNPDKEQDTQVTGRGQFVVPAHAGLTLSVSGSLGAGIPVVSGRAGLELSGGLGIAGALVSGVEINWTPQQGLVLDAKAEISAQPKLRFAINGFVLIEADLWVTTVSLYDKTWKLGSVEYGSGMTFGLALPIHYEEGKPFDLSLEDLEIKKPDMKPREVLTGLIGQIA
jgi:hypothetical protein